MSKKRIVRVKTCPTGNDDIVVAMLPEEAVDDYDLRSFSNPLPEDEATVSRLKEILVRSGRVALTGASVCLYLRTYRKYSVFVCRLVDLLSCSSVSWSVYLSVYSVPVSLESASRSRSDWSMFISLSKCLCQYVNLSVCLSIFCMPYACLHVKCLSVVCLSLGSSDH